MPQAKSFISVLLFLFFVFFGANCRAAATPHFPEVMIILDASGSMWGKTGGETKIAAAKDVLNQLVPSLPPEVKLGLTAYGHREKGNCDDIEILIPSGSDDRQGLLKRVNKIQPKGKTPIADSIKIVINTLKSKENETTIILVSDGEETCHPEPCDIVKALKATGIKFILHVVGFDVNSEQKKQLACLAQAGGGDYFGVNNAGDLLAALKVVEKEVIQKVTHEKAKTTQKKSTSRLGKLQITFPPGGEISLAHIKIIRSSDNKTIKTATKPGADTTHPLLADDYKVVLGYHNTNYQPASEITGIPVTITGGETAELRLGTLIFNVADSLKDLPASKITLRSDDGKTVLETPGKGNTYYFFTSKPLPVGTYSFEYFYKTLLAPVVAAPEIHIQAGQETILTLDSGIRLKKNEQSMDGFDLVPSTQDTPILQVRRRSDNDYPLWASFPIPPGTYTIWAHIKDMGEPLPVGEGVTIDQGQLLEFDTGL